MSIARVLNEALGQPTNHAGGARLAEAISSCTEAGKGTDALHFDYLKPDACGEPIEPNHFGSNDTWTDPVPPVVLGNPGLHTDASGKAIDTELSATFRNMIQVCREMPRDERGDARAFRMLAELLVDNAEMMVALLATETSSLKNSRMMNKAVRAVLAERPRR